tara:strand:- start:222 stop:626 length:405 start_codon:yes stop_codon:yes gene_type:complete
MDNLLFYIGHLKKILYNKELTQEEYKELFRENQKEFVEAYAKFKVFNHEYNKYRDDQSGYNDKAKYPWGYKAKFEALEIYLWRFATGTFMHGIPPVAWNEAYRDIEYSLDYYFKVKIPEKRERERQREKWGAAR